MNGGPRDDADRLAVKVSFMGFLGRRLVLVVGGGWGS